MSPASRQRIDLIVTTLALPAGSACHVDSRAAENALHQVYASSVFADLDQNQPPSIFARIGAAINWILSHLFGLLGSGGSILLGLLVLGAITAFVIYRLRGVAGGRRALASDEPATAGDDPDREWQLALAAAQRGDYREAIRRAFRSALLEVADRRAHLDRAWTTREMLATLSTDADLLAVVAPAAASFDRAWYGGEPVGAADWDVARARCEAVRRVARHAAGAPQPVSRPPLSAMLTLIAALCILAVIAISSAIPPNDQTNPSSRSAGTLGTLALYTWFSDLGLDVGRITGTLRPHRQRRRLLLRPDGRADRRRTSERVMTFLRSGGDLVLVVTPDSLAAAAPLLGTLDVNPSASPGSGIATVAQPFDSTDRVRSVPVGSGLTFSDQAPLVPMLVEQNEVVAGMVRVGAGGRAYVLGDTAPLSNDGLRHGDSVVPRAQPAAARSRWPDQLRRVSPRRGNQHQRRRRDLRRAGRPGDAADRAGGAPGDRVERPPPRQARRRMAARRRCRAPPRT